MSHTTSEYASSEDSSSEHGSSEFLFSGHASPDEALSRPSTPKWSSIPPEVWTRPPRVAERLEALFGESKNDGHVEQDPELADVEAPRNQEIEVSSGTKQHNIWHPPPPPPSPKSAPFLKCETCRGINLQSLIKPEGYRHLDGWVELARSARTCKVCHLIYREGSVHQRRSKNRIWHGHRPRLFDNKSPLSCRINHINGMSVMQVRSADLNFSSNLALFLDPDDSPSTSALLVSHWKTTNYQGRHFDLALEDARYDSEARPESRTVLRLAPRKLTATSSDKSFETARAWLDSCLTTHKACGLNVPNQPAISPEPGPSDGHHPLLPKRLIDLQHFGSDALDACVFTTHGQDIAYAALSYCWGTSEMPPYVTTSSNYEGTMRVLHFGDMPQTIRDAFQICRRLGLRYLWVDAICIVQDSSLDWHAEAMNMAAIYQNSQLTIAADGSTSVHGGCFNNQSINQMDTRRGKQVRILNRDDGGQACSIILSRPTFGNLAQTIIEISSLSQRGWAFQERALSPRILHYTSQQLIWECGETCEAEDGLRILDRNWQSLRTLCGLVGGDRGKKTLNSTYSSDHLLFGWYGDIVEPYSERHFTVWSDRWIALSGIVTALRPRIGAEFLCGIWLRRLELGLAWRRWDHPHEMELATGLRSSPRGTGGIPKTPSFSWLSFIGPVGWPIDERDIGKCTGLITLVEYGLDDASAPGATVTSQTSENNTSGWLRLRGQLRPVKVNIDLSNEEVQETIYFGHWLWDGLRERPGGYQSLTGDVVLDSYDEVSEVFCLPLFKKPDGQVFSLLVKQVFVSPGQYAWRRIGLAELTEVPRSWGTRSTHTILLV